MADMLPLTEQEERDAVQMAMLLAIGALLKAQRYSGTRPEYARFFADKVVDQLHVSGIRFYRKPPAPLHSTSSGLKP